MVTCAGVGVSKFTAVTEVTEGMTAASANAAWVEATLGAMAAVGAGTSQLYYKRRVPVCVAEQHERAGGIACAAPGAV